MEKIGKAYGFFYCGARNEEILEEVAAAREHFFTPGEMALRLTEGVRNLNTEGDSDLAEIVRLAHEKGFSHVLEGSMPNVENKEVARKLGDIFCGLYASRMYEKGEEFFPGVFYRDENGEYDLLEQKG